MVAVSSSHAAQDKHGCPRASPHAVRFTFGLQLGPQVDRLVSGLVGVREVARIPGRCADRRNIRPGEQEAGGGRLLRLQLSRDGSLSIRLCQTLDVPSVPTR